MMDLSKENSRRADESRNYFRLTLDSIEMILMEGMGVVKTSIWYDSVGEMMKQLQDDIISKTQEEADEANLSDGVNIGHSFTVTVMKTGDSKKSDDANNQADPSPLKDPSVTKRSISCYISAVAEIEGRDDLELLVILRLSDHDREVKPIMIKLDINKWIRIKGRSGDSYNWSDFDWETQKIDMINGKDVKIISNDSSSRVIKGAQFSIAPDVWEEVVRRGQRIIMDRIHEFADDHRSNSWSSS